MIQPQWVGEGCRTLKGGIFDHSLISQKTFFLNFLFYLGNHSDVINHLFSHDEAQGRNLTAGWVFIAHIFRAPHKQCEVAILILINISLPIKFRIVK